MEEVLIGDNRGGHESFSVGDGTRPMIQETATKDAPWYVLPADNKWFTRVVVASAVIETLASLDLAYPKVDEGKLKELAAAKKKLVSK